MKVFFPEMLRVCGRLLCEKPSPFLKTDGYKQHVFRWGIGNKFRSINANRFSPVHLPRPKEVTVREDYFESPDESIVYDPVNEQWEVYWHEHMKLTAKPFPVKKFGIEQSKTQAIKFLEELRAAGKLGTQDNAREMTSNVGGVFWDDRLQSWISITSEGSRAFSASKHGSAKAKQLAEDRSESSEGAILRKKIADRIRDYMNSPTS